MGAFRALQRITTCNTPTTRWAGVPTNGVDKERAWPRTGATIYGQAPADTLIPQRVVNRS
jgi:hypothetical protein